MEAGKIERRFQCRKKYPSFIHMQQVRHPSFPVLTDMGDGATWKDSPRSVASFSRESGNVRDNKEYPAEGKLAVIHVPHPRRSLAYWWRLRGLPSSIV